MIHPDNRLFCRLDGETVSAREQRRMLAIAELSLLELTQVSVFDEATQTAAHFLNAPVSILSLMDQHCQSFKSSTGLSRLGLMNDLATSRQLPRSESFCTHVVDSHQVLAIEDTFAHPAFANSLLTQQYGVRAYLSVPLMTSTGFCIGTLAVMDLRPHLFTHKDIEFLELTARWSMSEFERQQALKNLSSPPVPTQSETRKTAAKISDSAPASTVDVITDATSTAIASQLKIELLSQLTQELRTPLTSVMGMASVLMREIYGPLTGKQKEYLGIIHHSGQYLLSLVNEILELSSLKDSNQLQLTSVDIEMLCQQAINTLTQAAQRREQQIALSIEPGRRIWLLDKEKVRQMLYHLVFSVIHGSNAGSTIRIHVSHRQSNLILSIWVSHPWLGEGLPYPEILGQSMAQPLTLPIAHKTDVEASAYLSSDLSANDKMSVRRPSTKTATVTDQLDAARKNTTTESSRNLGLLLSRHLAEMHHGQLTIQSASETGYRYVVSLPQNTQPATIDGFES